MVDVLHVREYPLDGHGVRLDGARPTTTSTPSYEMLAQNMPMTPRQGAHYSKGLSNLALNVLPRIPESLPSNLPQPQQDIMGKPFSKYHESNAFNALAWTDKSDVKEVELKLIEAEPSPAFSQNMPVDLDGEDPSIVLTYPPAQLDEDARELALSLWAYFWPLFAESMRSTTLRPRQTDGSIEYELPEIVAQRNFFNCIAENLDYFLRVRALREYTGTAVHVDTLTVTAPAEPGFTSFTTVVRVSSFPGMSDLSFAAATATATSSASTTASITIASTTASTTTTTDQSSSRMTASAEASHTCSDGRVLGATQECGAPRAGDLTRLLWPVCFSLIAVVAVIVVPSFSGIF
jgi:hypothetical protein